MLTTLNLIVTAFLLFGCVCLLLGWALCAAGKWADERAARLREDALWQQWRDAHARDEAERRKAQGLTSYARRDDPESAA